MARLRVVLFANTEWYLFNFRLSLARALRQAGAEVVLISPNGPYGARLQSEGFRWIPVPMNRRSINPVRELSFLYQLIRLYRRETPTVVHHFTIKCVVYGSLAARFARIERRINAVAGLGYVFTSGEFLARLLRPFVRGLMKLALGGNHTRLILQNVDDCAAIQKAKLITEARVRLIRGSGVNIVRFQPRNETRPETHLFRVILAARLLWDKGVREYVEAAKQLKAAGLSIEFLLAGSPDPGNPATVDRETVQAWHDAGLVTALGHVEDMAKLLHEVDATVLPSYYREGVPRSLIEAAACGLPIVTTDAPGCREVVDHGKNGLLVPVRNAKALADAIRYLHDHPVERARMGIAGREKVLREFDERIVLARTLDVYRELIPHMSRPAAVNAG